MCVHGDGDHGQRKDGVARKTLGRKASGSWGAIFRTWCGIEESTLSMFGFHGAFVEPSPQRAPSASILLTNMYAM